MKTSKTVFKIVAMIPARLGSKRVKLKNLRLLAGQTLCHHITRKCKEAGVFDEIYINSESDIFKTIADECGVSFYKRDSKFAQDEITNDLFANDFLNNIDCDILIQINPTSPLLSTEDIKKFVTTMIDNNYDTLHSVEEKRIESIYKNKPLNFDPMKIMPKSQDLMPIYFFSSGIMGWKSLKHQSNMAKYGCATYGGKGKTGYFILKGYSTIDIDNEEDFQMAEIAMKQVNEGGDNEVRYYKQKKQKEHSEADVPSILKKDGVLINNLFDANKEIVHIKDIVKSFPIKKSWSHRVVNTESNSATLICQIPGEGNRLHYHNNWNEWWYIVEGEWLFEIEGKNRIVKKGDVVFIAKNRIHRITAKGRKPAIRLAVSREDVAHIYPEA